MRVDNVYPMPTHPNAVAVPTVETTWVSVKRAAEIAGDSEKAIRCAIERGNLRADQSANGRLRIRLDYLHRYIMGLPPRSM